MNTAMDSIEKQDVKLEDGDTDNVEEFMERLQSELFGQVREVSHLVVKARLQAREADIRARYAAEFAERAVSEAQLAHMVASTLAKTARVVASMALEFANNVCLDTSGDGDYLNFSLPDSNSSLQSGDSSGNTTFEVPMPSPVAGIKSTSPLRNPRRRSPKCSPRSSAQKHETTYPEDLSPEDSLSEMLDGSKSLPTVWEESYSNGWESTPERWADKKITLQMLRKLQSRKDNKKRPNSTDYDADDADQENVPPFYKDGEMQTTNSDTEKENDMPQSDNDARNDKITRDVEGKAGKTENPKLLTDQAEVSSSTETVKVDKEGHVSSSADTLTSASVSSSDELYKVNGFGLDEEACC